LVSTLEERAGLGQGRPVRIDFENVADVGRKVKLRLVIGETTVEAVEQRLRAWVPQNPRKPMSTSLRLDRLLGREVRTANNRRLGRLEEFRAERRGSDWVVTE
jgi:hypothetical protein